MGRIYENDETRSKRTTRNKRKTSKKGKILPETEDVTHSCSALTSKMTSRQEVDIVSKRKTKAKELKDSDCASPMTESISKSQETKTKDPKMASMSEENDGFSFEFSKKLIALAREKQDENRELNRRCSESKTLFRKRKVSRNGGSHDSSGLKRKLQKLSQSASSSEDFSTSIREMFQNNLTNEKKMKVENTKRWNTAANLAPMDFEFSRRLTYLSRKNQRYQHEEHAHCCRCVQSFECFWPRSNLQTIRKQGVF